MSKFNICSFAIIAIIFTLMTNLISSTNKIPIVRHGNSSSNSSMEKYSNSSRHMFPNFRKTEGNQKERMDFLKGTTGNFSSPTNFYNGNNAAVENSGSHQRFPSESVLPNGPSKSLKSLTVEATTISRIGTKVIPEKDSMLLQSSPNLNKITEGDSLSSFKRRHFRKVFVRSRKSTKLSGEVKNEDREALSFSVFGNSTSSPDIHSDRLVENFQNFDTKLGNFRNNFPSAQITDGKEANISSWLNSSYPAISSTNFKNWNGDESFSSNSSVNILPNLLFQDHTQDDEGTFEQSLDTNSTQVEIDELSDDSGMNDLDVVTKFLRIIESQQSMGENCTKGTGYSLGDGVVDKYAHERFRLQADLTVNLANLYTRLWKYSRDQVLSSDYLLHAQVLSLLEFNEDIFAAGNCYDRFEHPNNELFCPFAHKLPDGKVKVKDLAQQYFYLSNGSDFFLDAKRSGEKVIEEFTQLRKAYHTFTHNMSAQSKPFEEEILSVTYEDGIWTKPYYDCGGGNIWMMTYTVPFFGYSNGQYHFKGTSGIDVDLRRVDIDQCPLPANSTTRNIFASSDKCKNTTTECVSIPGLGFRRGSYKCVCKDGFYFPEVTAKRKYYNGSVLEAEYEKKFLHLSTLYDSPNMFECLPCAAGCETCQDDAPCVVALNWVMRTGILVMTLVLVANLPVISLLTWRCRHVKVVRAASPALLQFIILGALLIYSTSAVQYPKPSVFTCSLRVWLREIGFSLTYGALMLKTWRISVVFRVRSAKAVKITDLMLLKRLGIIVGGFSLFLAIRTIVDPPKVMISYTQDGLKAFLCSTNWWDHVFTGMEMLFLVWGIRLCIVVRKAPSEFNESRFISMAIYNEFLLTLFLNVSMLFLRSPANPDLLYIIYFSHSQLTITLLLALIFGSKAYMVIKGQDRCVDSTNVCKTNPSKLHSKSKYGSSAYNYHQSTSVTSTLTPSDADLQAEFKRLFLHLESLKEKNIRLNNHSMVSRISAMQAAASHTNLIDRSVEISQNSALISWNGNSTTSNLKHTYKNFQPEEQNLQPSNDINQLNDVGWKLKDGDVDDTNVNAMQLYQLKPSSQPMTEDSDYEQSESHHLDDDILPLCFRSANPSNVMRRHYSAREESGRSKQFKPVIRCKSSTDKSLSDGIVMRPLIASICPNLQENLLFSPNAPVADEFNGSNGNSSTEFFLDNQSSFRDVTIQTSRQTICGIENSTQTSNVERFFSSGLLGDNISRRLSLCDDKRKLSDVSDITLPVFRSYISLMENNSNETSTNNLTIPYNEGTNTSLNNIANNNYEYLGSMLPQQRITQEIPSSDSTRNLILQTISSRKKKSEEMTV